MGVVVAIQVPTPVSKSGFKIQLTTAAMQRILAVLSVVGSGIRC